MKLIGIIGGVTWESTKEYYRILNEETRKRLGGWYSARILLYSLNFAEVLDIQKNKGLDELGRLIEDAAIRLAKGAADFILIGANTMHRFVDRVEKASGLKVLHIADPTGDAVKAQGLSRVGLLGTRYTMEEDFIKGRYVGKHNLDIIVPDDKERLELNDIIYNELARGVIKDDSRQAFLRVVNTLIEQGTEGIILGCTEIPLIVKQEQVAIPVFNTTELHAKAAIDWALA